MKRTNALILLILCLVLTSCSAENENTVAEDKTNEVVAVDPIQVEGLNATLQSYKMTYMSEGEEAVAYVSLPKKSGTYNINLVLHGGFPASKDLSHVSDMMGITFDESMLRYSASPGLISLVPLYRGYGESGGTVPGLNGTTLDTSHAIDALTAYLEKNETRKSTGKVFVMGTSLGGGVGLKLATIRDDIADVVAISPYVGLDPVYPWLLENPDKDIGFLEMFQEAYGDYDQSSKQTKEESIDVKKIDVPVLIVQGDADRHIDWHPVKSFYDGLKKENDNTTFELIPDGDHGLMNKQEELNGINSAWFDKQF
ncbi:alpha/beta fold hydrolase [Rossellomorea sp. SC111]|uniref:alpha/beta hydrolase family protein n=1 Tax=Rossellomorea sp. SC111 TaxID=2968985 RepID=UPI00215B5ACB|nr:alpha/beta fold hydrolase [Rossellomorea sp. SC111]MCR8848011.1 alpha/beta fold hydrolase [Rossellomorea sp. SC111]